MIKRASLHSLGCRLNQAETSVLESQLRRRGYTVVPWGQPTDLLVVNTCSVTAEAERTCRYVIRKTLMHSPDAYVAVTGCYAQTGMQQLRSIPGIDLIVGNQFKSDLPSFLPTPEALRKQPTPEFVHTRTIARHEFVLPEFGESDATRAPLKIQDGCNVMCSFCLIPFARGHERSRLLDNIIAEAEWQAGRGRRELVLTGVNIGRFHSKGLDLAGLIDRLQAVEGIHRIRLSSIEPTTVTDSLLERIAAGGKLCPYLHLPLQSGNDAVLGAMNRPYDVASFTSLIERSLARVPHLALGTDVMVGFPGESEQSFQDTVDLCSRLPFFYFHVFTYSKRPGTAAAKMQQHVSPPVARRRAQTLAELSRQKRLAYAERWIGRCAPVLFEEGETEGLRLGTTPQFLKVGVTSEAALSGQIRDVRIIGASDRWAVGHLISPDMDVEGTAP
ncbi:MAG TPA: tRNA (N(6)-L-threonylcarbamoyladenosine(37)-C(2))-methylthiotransferase MtaB [Nitrospira sp.]|nr:tRNA (N(6)-L-threonylcarbamoyladenosine(37)-C(2))-methylthiotransferase MtaB [Nitrospira sp.]